MAAEYNPRKRPRETDTPRRVASHIETVGPRRSFQTPTGIPQAPLAPASVPVEQSRERCLRCRKGARVCVYPEDELTCMACMRAKTQCKLPTSEEDAALNARCQQCITRGLVNCDRNLPCNGCIRRKRPERCGKLPGESQSKRVKRESLPSPELEEIEAVDDVEATEDVGTAEGIEVAEKAQPSRDSEEHHGAIGTADALTLQLSPQCLEKLYTSGRLVVLDESGEFKATFNVIRVDAGAFISNHSNEHTTEGGETIVVEPSPPETTADTNDDEEATPGAESGAEKSHSLSSIPTNRFMAELRDCAGATHTTSDEEDPTETEPPYSLSRSVGNESGSRPRRSRARVSYVLAPPSDISDQEFGDDTESDTYESFHADGESEVDDEMSIDHIEEEDSSQEMDLAENSDVDDVEPELVAKPQRKTQHAQNPQRKTGKGIDHSLPPLHDVEHIFEDLTLRGVGFGLCEALEKLAGRPINVATMCSGTESPLIALDLISKALEQNHKPSFRVKHRFSAEIDATKQGYIERNFGPKKLFRDVREFLHEHAKYATTAYGAQVSIPGRIDILIAGFVCKDISTMNNHKKDLEDDGESGDTWRAIYNYAKLYEPSIVLIENVTGRTAYWDKLKSKWSQIGYECSWMICDTKQHYIPQTRQRMYMIAINRNLYGKNAEKAVGEWEALIKKLQRQCSSPYEAFLTGLSQESADYNALPSEYDWALCKLRYDHIRSDQRLGIMRPITQWNENGTLRPPDFANRKWYNSQSSRVYDAIDVAHLQSAKNGSDSMYKMAIWDVSQNVDRFKADLGLVPCITPGGCDFASNYQQALTGSQLLVLQGMPMDKLLFAGESQKDCQDLAGNAMSTTVIGTSLIAAIICGARSFRATETDAEDELSTAMIPTRLSSKLVRPPSKKKTDITPADMADLGVADLISEAIPSSRMCKCEGDKKITDTPIQICSACGHTACLLCAGNPKHEYGKTISTQRTQTPDDFARRWRSMLPARLKFENFPNTDQLAAKAPEIDPTTEAFLDRMSELDIGTQHFYISDVQRQDKSWKVLYVADEATLELNVSEQTQWLLFAKCSPECPSNSVIRKILEQPIARGAVSSSLTDPQWEVFVPCTKKFILQIKGSSKRTKSWRNRLGLPDFKSETTPVSLHIQSRVKEGKALEGDYIIQPHCGTASASLYKSSHGKPIFLFLDPNPIGSASDDCFVFSHDCTRKHYGEARVSLARLNSSWRPWQIDTEDERDVNVESSGVWTSTSMRLVLPSVSISACVFPIRKLAVQTWDGCRDAVTVLHVSVSEELTMQKFSDYSWALEQAKLLPSLSDWQSVGSIPQACDCAPSYPSILWSIDNAGVATAHEDRKAAAIFERSVKTRCPIFHIRANNDSGEAHIEIGVNVASLCHRAASRLNNSGPVETTWRLLTDHADKGFERLPKFRLRSNAADASYTGPLRLQHELRGAQPRSLSWMKAQEKGVSLTITEVEEDIHSGLGWRVEARAQTSVEIRGGVLADAPSFGKTVTTIALIQSEFEEYTPDALLQRNGRLTEGLPELIDAPGTLIVCPPHMVIQWREELKSFLGGKQYDKFNVLLIEDFSQLRNLTIDTVETSRVIILSWNVFADEEYISELARFATMPEPAATSRRAYSAWLSKVIDEVPQRLDALEQSSYDHFQNDGERLLEARLQDPAFQAAIPLRVQHGSSYQSFNAMQKATGKHRASGVKPKSRPKAKPKSRATHPPPFLHLFRFNRLVVDEYHYLNQDKKIENVLASVSVKSIAAIKRWVLSGTPALANFHDIDQIASFLGTKLGRFANGASRTPTQLEKAIKDDQTDVEKFLSKTEIMSQQWHQARHELAQVFLDRFVRQNDPSLEHIHCSEELRPVELNVAHHAVYLELSQHLISQRMQVRKLNNKTNSDRLQRLSASLNNSATAEDALLKSALLFKTVGGESGIQALMQKREEQRRSTEGELLRLLRGFEGLKKDANIADLYNGFKSDVKIANWLGDESASKRLCSWLKKAEGSPTKGGFEELKRIPKSKLTQEIKKLMSQLREAARELALRFRSERFIRAIEGLLVPLSMQGAGRSLICNSSQCEGAPISRLNLASQCGHLACDHCLSLRTDGECCVHPGCSVTVQAVNLIKATDLGSTREQVAERSFGRKMDAIADLILDTPKRDQCLVFAPNDETIDILEEVFDHRDIAYSSTRGVRPSAVARVLEDFKTSSNKKSGGSKVLILNLMSETAAGVNLINANHVVFVAPLLVKSQYEYESAMTQAIARSRRYGQEKRVHIYHFAALRTIDVDILEHRHKRRDGITTAKMPMHLPEPLTDKKEKTRLVENDQKCLALVPVSWLATEPMREILGVKERPDSFTSLINFSETFEDEEEEA